MKYKAIDTCNNIIILYAPNDAEAWEKLCKTTDTKNNSWILEYDLEN